MLKSVLISFCLCILPIGALFAQMPDTTSNRYATTEDAVYWNNVNEGDYIFFTGNSSSNQAIYAGGTNFHVELDLGEKILIWRGEYQRILIDGQYCESSESQPTIITNLGGQVKWGNSLANNTNRTLELQNFEHIYLTGKYDVQNQTGNSEYLGHNEGSDYDTGKYYEKYGMWGNPQWSGLRTVGKVSNIVRIFGFKTCKISYVCASHGGFAGFNVKSDNPANPERVKIDIQDCFTGWTESEGFYISYSSTSSGQDLTELTLKNNVIVFAGTESLQTDNLTEGTVIEHNVAFAGACFYRRPFQDQFQDGLHQFSFVEGGVSVNNNIMINGNSMHQLRFKEPEAGRAFPSAAKKVLMKDNYYGYSRSNISYVWSGDGITPYEVDGNIYGPVDVPSTRDAYDESGAWGEFFKVCNTSNPITFKNIIYPEGKLFYKHSDCGNSSANVDTSNLKQETAPLVNFINSGFNAATDYRNITFWSASYGTADKEGVFIPYELGDMVFYYDENGNTKFYNCIQAHSGDFDPNVSPAYWEQMTWDNEILPPLDLRLTDGSFYEAKDIGLTYKKNLVTAINSGGKSFENKLLTVYPNPTTGIIQFSKETSYSIINSLGQRILTGDGNQVDLSSQDQGVYILQIEQSTFKIIKH